ncbi:MAG: hypothetical protein ACK5S6_04355 [bacterium]|jgi:hypothetical protein
MWAFQPLLPGGAQQLSGPAPVSTGYVKYWTGSQWSIKPVKYWTGTQWTIKPVKHWTGSAWVATTPE